MLRKAKAALAAMAVLALPVGASAAPNGDQVLVKADTGLEMRRITIFLNDINLASADGRRIADKRIKNAALVACAWSTGTVLAENDAYRDCYASAMEEGHSQMVRTAENQRKDRLAS